MLFRKRLEKDNDGNRMTIEWKAYIIFLWVQSPLVFLPPSFCVTPTSKKQYTIVFGIACRAAAETTVYHITETFSTFAKDILPRYI